MKAVSYSEKLMALALLSFVSVRQARSEAAENVLPVWIAGASARVGYPFRLRRRNADHSRPLRTLSVEGGHCLCIEWFDTARGLEIFWDVATRAAKENVASLHEGPIAAE